MKIRIPPGCTAVSYQGCLLPIEDDGSIDVDETTASILAAHGFESMPLPVTERPFDIEGTDEVARLNRNGLFSLLRSRGVSVSLPVTNQALRDIARKALEQ